MPEPRRSLPPHPSLDQQKKLAKELLKSYRAGDAAARARVREPLPDKQNITLADAQFVIAREYGFANWSALKEHIGRSGSHEAVPESIKEEFMRAIHARDAVTLRGLFRKNPQAAAMINEPLFSFDTPALVHVAGDEAALPVVEVLLESGADPNRRSDWWAGGFHVLHSARGETADRLMAAGALPDACGAANLDRAGLLRRMLDEDPARVHERGGDGQTPLHFARSREVIDLLLERGADPDARDMDHRSTPAQWMLSGRRGAGRYALAAYLVERGATADIFLASALGLTSQLRELLEADSSLLELRTHRGAYGEQPPSSYHIYTWTIGQNLSPLQVAAQFGQAEALDLLRSFAGPKDRFLEACTRGDAVQAKRLLAGEPDMLARLSASDVQLLPDAAWAGNARAVDLMLEIGFDPGVFSANGGNVLHCAAWEGILDCVDVALRYPAVRALIEQRDRKYGGTPLGWCCHGSLNCGNPASDHAAVARRLLEAGAQPGPELADASAASEAVLAVIREFRKRQR
jgi:ankyrin repeat protein